ncbi:MAG TPA: hypothetical protein VGO73_02355, partial [Pyrinomonadaceae bacterium]|nr:hypothetical protein [Pyrinomonadaceae bacterium]
RGFKLEVQQIVVCRFAPAGRDVYSLAVFIYSGAPWERNRYCTPERRFRQVSLLFAPNGARSLSALEL